MKTTDTNKKAKFFSGLLKRAMSENGWKQSDLARELKKDRATINNWINLKQTPYDSTIINICNLLGYAVQIDGDDISYSKDSGPLLANDPKATYKSNDLNQILIDVLDDANDEDREVLGRYFLEVLHRYNRS